MKLKHCGLLTFGKDFLKKMERWDNFQIPVTDPSIDEFMADVNQFRNIDQYFRWTTSPDKTQYEILELQQFSFWIAFDDLKKEMAEL